MMNLKEARQQQGLSLYRLGQMSGVNSGQILFMEEHATTRSFWAAEALSNALNKRPDEIEQFSGINWPGGQCPCACGGTLERSENGRCLKVRKGCRTPRLK